MFLLDEFEIDANTYTSTKRWESKLYLFLLGWYWAGLTWMQRKGRYSHLVASALSLCVRLDRQQCCHTNATSHTMLNDYQSGKKKAHKHKCFCSVAGTNSVKTWDKPGFSPYFTQWKPDKQSLASAVPALVGATSCCHPGCHANVITPYSPEDPRKRHALECSEGWPFRNCSRGFSCALVSGRRLV